MRRCLLLSSIIILALLVLSVGVYAARIPGIVVLVDMSHGQNPGGLAEMLKVVPEAYWIVLVATEEDVGKLPEEVRELASEIRVGGFTDENLADVDMVIIGQPTKLPSDEEVEALAKWFHTHKGDYRIKALWVAADSDYPAQGSETAQEFANIVLEAIGSKLRIDYVSVEEYADGYFAEKTYRVLGKVDPPPELAFLGYGAEKVLFHGPGVVAAIGPDGSWVNPLATPVKDVYVIAHTVKGKIVEHQPKAPGAPGHIGIVYHPGDEGVFPLLAVEIMAENEIVIASGESPYSGYQGGITWQYKGYTLDGPRFFRNLVLWATQYMGELKEAQKLYDMMFTLGVMADKIEKVSAQIGKVSSELDKVKGDIGTLGGDVGKLKSDLESLKASLSDLKSSLNDAKSKIESLSKDLSGVKGTLGTLSSSVDALKADVSTLKSDVGTLKGLSGKVSDLESAINGVKNMVGGLGGTVNASIAIAIIALILAIVALAFAFRRK